MTTYQCRPTGLMAQIQALINPSPSFNSTTTKKKSSSNSLQKEIGSIASKCNRKSNNEFCDSCQEGGMLLCCDRCPAAFHLTCNIPPLEIEDVPDGEWICFRCRNLANISDSDFELVLNSLKQSPFNEANDVNREICKDNNDNHVCDENNVAELEMDHVIDEADCVGKVELIKQPLKLDEEPEAFFQRLKTTFHLFTQHGRLINPHQFELPSSLTENNPFINPKKQIFVSSDQYTNNSTSFNLLTAAPRAQSNHHHHNHQQAPSLITRNRANSTSKSEKPTDSKVFCVVSNDDRSPAYLTYCYKCHQSCQKAPLIKCDFCPLAFHADCLDPPLTTLHSSTSWMCPVHPHHYLEKKLLKNEDSLSERIKLWNRYSNVPVDPVTITIDFLKKLHNDNDREEDFDCEDEDVLENVSLPATNVPSSIKDAYRDRKELFSNNSLAESATFTKSDYKPPTEKETEDFLNSLVMFQLDDCPNSLQHQVENNVSCEKPICDIESTSKLDCTEFTVANTHLHSSKFAENGIIDCSDIPTFFSEVEPPINGESSNDLEVLGLDSLTKLDDNLIQLLAYQRLQQLQFDISSIRKNSTLDPGLIDKTLHFGSNISSLAVLCPVSTSDVSQQCRPMVYRTFTIGTSPDSDLNITEFGFCNHVSSKHAIIIYDQTEKSFQLINYSEHGTTVDNVLYSFDTSTKPAHTRHLYRSIEDITICGIKDIVMSKDSDKKMICPDRTFLREEIVQNSDGYAIIGRAHNDLLEINAQLQKQNDSKNKNPAPIEQKNRSCLKKISANKSKLISRLATIKKRKYRRTNSLLESDDSTNTTITTTDMFDMEHDADVQSDVIDESVDVELVAQRWESRQEMPKVKMNAWSEKQWRPCACDNQQSTSNKNGWEGSALLHHGSLVQLGCLEFVFSISAFGK